MASIQQHLFDLDRAHARIKVAYEDEIRTLQAELERYRGPGSGTATRKQVTTNRTTSFPQVSAEVSTQDVPQEFLESDTRSQISNSLAVTEPGRKMGQGWFSIFPGYPRQQPLDVDLMYTLRHNSVVCCVTFSPNGEYVATGCNRSAMVWSVANGSRIATLRDASGAGALPSDPHQDNSSSHAEGNVINTHTEADGEDGSSNAASGTVNGALPSGDLYIRSVSFSPDSRLVASGAEDRVIRLWDFIDERIVRVFTGHEADIYALDFAPSGELVVSGSGDCTARIWNVHQGNCVHVLVHDESTPVLCANGDVLAVEAESVPSVPRNSGDTGVTSVVFSPCSRFVATGSLDTFVRIFDVATGVLLDRLTGHEDSVYSVSFRSDGRQLASGSLDRTVRLWDIPDYGPASDLAAEQRTAHLPRATQSCVLEGHKDFVLSVAFAADGRFVASGSKDRSVCVWDTRTKSCIATLQGHKNSVISVALASRGSNELVLASGSGDQRARIWRLPPIPAVSQNGIQSHGHGA
jgi:glucose repression regulatory protein TUP1